MLTKPEYESALDRINKIIDAGPGTPELKELIALVDQVEEYEDHWFPIIYGDLFSTNMPKHITHYYQVCDCIDDKIRAMAKVLLTHHIINCDCKVCELAREILTISEQVRGGERDGV